jgi:hypothetical protein
MTDILIERDDPEMALDDDEMALLQEVEIDERPLKHKRRHIHRAMHQEEEEPVEIADAFMNPEKHRTAPPPQRGGHEDDVIDYGENNDEMMYEPREERVMGEMGEAPSPGFASIDDEKADILNKLQRLGNKKSLRVNNKLNMYSDITELRSEIKRVRYSIEVDQSVKFSRRALVACITGLEFLNKRYDPFDLKLEGWSETMMENVEDYDEVFEELYVKYRTSVNVPPEIKLIMMVGGSGMMFHLTNSMFKSVMPNVNDVMKQNPDLMHNMMSAVQNTYANNQTAGDPRPAPPIPTNGRREMKGPGIDLGSLMGNMMPPPPVNTFSGDVDQNTIDQPPMDDDISDIVSVVSGDNSDVKEVNLKAGPKRRGRRKKTDPKNEVSI